MKSLDIEHVGKRHELAKPPVHAVGREPVGGLLLVRVARLRAENVQLEVHKALPAGRRVVTLVHFEKHRRELALVLRAVAVWVDHQPPGHTADDDRGFSRRSRRFDDDGHDVFLRVAARLGGHLFLDPASVFLRSTNGVSQ